MKGFTRSGIPEHLILILFFLASIHCRAQYAVTDFAPREHIIFKDDFGDDPENAFPHQWGILSGVDPAYSNRKCYQVKKTAAGAELEVRDGMIDDIFPAVPAPYLPDSFTFSYDFLIAGVSSEADVLFIDSSALYSACEIRLSGMGDFTYQDKVKGHAPHTVNYAAIFKGDSQWHHLDVSWNRRRMMVYVDQYAMIPPVVCNSTPRSFQLHCWPPVKYKNVLVTGGRLERVTNMLLTQKKLVTHTIHFDVNKSEIKQESMPFIRELASWLKQNKTVELEIDGHTDSDGDATANLKLSQARADEVKKQLVLLGIKAARLTTNGYGATKPVQDNVTAEGRAENRRVEFVRR